MFPSMNETARYTQVDLPFYQSEVAAVLPAAVLDFHTHIWRPDQRLAPGERDQAPGSRYVVVEDDYSIEALLADGARLFPGRGFSAVCFGNPTPATDTAKTNAYAAQATARPGLFPLIITGRDTLPPDELERRVRQEGFFGYKVYLPWRGDDYGQVTIEQMIGPAQMSLADELGLVVLLHVPRAGRLADPLVQEGVRRLAGDSPRAAIVLAHCGRCYLPDEMQAASGAVRDLANVYLDTAMVMDPTVLQIALEQIGPERLLFATDLPVAAMRGRRVYVMDHWVDVVLSGYPQSAYRVASDDIRATFMAWEIVLAVRRAAERVGLDEAALHAIFYDNGMALLRHAALAR